MDDKASAIRRGFAFWTDKTCTLKEQRQITEALPLSKNQVFLAFSHNWCYRFPGWIELH
jgi:hypothetical protein